MCIAGYVIVQPTMVEIRFGVVARFVALFTIAFNVLAIERHAQDRHTSKQSAFFPQEVKNIE